MARAKRSLSIMLWSTVVLAVLWIGLGDRLLTHLAYAVERGRIQASNTELAELQAELPEVYAVARAFKLVSKVARPGVVHIRVSGGDHSTMSDEEIDDFLREHLKDVPPAEPDDKTSPDEPEPNAPGKSDSERRGNAGEGGKDATPPGNPSDSDKLKERRDQIERWLRRMRPPPASGSGIIFDADGHILTNNHVVTGRTDFRVVLYDDREYDAKLIGTDPKTDLAVLKIEAPDLHPLTFGDSDKLEVGDWVLAVGSPFDLRQTVTHGIVSAKGRTRIPGVAIMYQDFIQTDAAINPGNSGGPLLNLRGEVVGVNTAIATHGDGVNAGIAFTIPSNMAVKVATQLKSSGTVTRAWLGISLSDVLPEDVEIFGLPDRHGVFVDTVLDDSPAEKAGLQVEDVILKINDVPIDGLVQLRELVADLTPDEVAHLRVVRDREERAVDVTLGVQPQNPAMVLRSPNGQAREINRLGLYVRTFRPEFVRQGPLAYGASERGVLVMGLDPAWRNPPDIAQRELIVGCNGAPVKSVRDLNAALQKAPANEKVRLEILEPAGDRRIISVKPQGQK